MTDVTFDEEPRYQRTRPQAATSSEGSIIGLMYKLGLAKTKSDANLVMGGIIVVCIVVSASMYVFVQPHTDPVKAAQLQQDVERMNAQLKAQAQPH